MQILDIQDDYQTEIRLNEQKVHKVDTFTIQVEKELLERYDDNTLHILYKRHPKLVDSAIPAQDQKVDIPIELLECILLGMAVKAHSMSILTNDPRTGSSYVQNPYIDRYELAIKKALENGYITSTNFVRKDYKKKGFV